MLTVSHNGGGSPTLSGDPRGNLYQRFLAEHSFQPCSLSDGKTLVVFHVNPTSWHYETEALYYEAPAYAGLVRWDYGTKPFPLTLQGTTGNAGRAAAPGGLYDLEIFRPQHGRILPMLTLSYPARFHGTWQVRVNYMSDDISENRSLYHAYEMRFTVYPQAATVPAIRLASGIAGISLPVGG